MSSSLKIKAYVYWFIFKRYFKKVNWQIVSIVIPLIIFTSTIAFDSQKARENEESTKSNIRLMLASEIKFNLLTLTTSGRRDDALDNLLFCAELPEDPVNKSKNLITLSNYISNDIYNAYLDKLSILESSENAALVQYYNAIRRFKRMATNLENKSASELMTSLGEISLMEKEFLNIYNQSSGVFSLIRSKNSKIPAL
ncbi:hypothetical protein [Pectobacterium versatile]|uniref:hypothetical protein n=1 Tax=Pectobacterium versatile TaxID=2488639 RepID=UPI001F2B3DFB|nr:hypothetical protein [Pectobacterium versatile]